MTSFRVEKKNPDAPKASLVKGSFIYCEISGSSDRVLVIAELAIRQNTLAFSPILRLPNSWIPRFLSFSTPEHGRRFSSVEAKAGLPFL
jgi:hypothetical protein